MDFQRLGIDAESMAKFVYERTGVNVCYSIIKIFFFY